MVYINGKQKKVSQIRTEIKRGATAEDLSSFFEVNVETFLEKLKVRLPDQTYLEYVKLMGINQDRKDKRNKRNAEADPTQKEEASVENSNKLQSKDENLGNEDEIRLNELESLISTYKDEINHLYDMLCCAIQENEAIDAKIEEAKGKLQSLIEEVKKLQEELHGLSESKETKNNSINEIRSNIAEKTKLLEDAETELEFYQKIKISILETSIQISKEGLEASDEEIEKKFLLLSEEETYADYSVRNLRKAAEVICIIENSEIMGFQYTVEYDKYEAVKEIVEKFLKFE